VLTPILVMTQFGLATILADQPWWAALLSAVCVGAFIVHRLNVIIHECAHNLVFRPTSLNKALAIFANLPEMVPAAIGFRHFHLLHHRFAGQPGLDADIAPTWEARLVGRAAWRKLLWLLAMPFVYTVAHPLQVQRRLPIDFWFTANVVLVLAAAAIVVLLAGWTGFAYLALSSYFAVGPHPTGAHILQEHIIFGGCYETSSYYGPINAISGNIGFHVEHHDFTNVPGCRIADLHRMASTYYRERFFHRSRLQSLWRFVTDRRIGLDSRVTVNNMKMTGEAASQSAWSVRYGSCAPSGCIASTCDAGSASYEAELKGSPVRALVRTED
jgi:sphingolipid delta-4 desaturase